MKKTISVLVVSTFCYIVLPKPFLKTRCKEVKRSSKPIASPVTRKMEPGAKAKSAAH